MSFTKRDDACRLVNWQVTHDRNEDWGDKYAIGQGFLAEIAELATHSELEAYHAVQYALSGGGDFRRGEATTFGNTGWGEECGFAEAIARTVIDGLRARNGGQESFSPDKAPRPMHVDDAVEYFKSCADAFACLSVLLGAIQDTPDGVSTDSLLISGLHIADRFSSLADQWRIELKAGGFQP